MRPVDVSRQFTHGYYPLFTEVHGLLREFRVAKSQCRVRSAAHGIISISTSPSIGKKLNIAASGYNFDRDAEQDIVPTCRVKNRVKRLKKKLDHKVVGVIHGARKKARINLETGLKGRVNRLLIKGVIRDGTGRRNKNRRTKAGGRRKRDGFLKEITLRGQLASIIAEGFGIVKGVAHGVADNVPAFKSMITHLTKNDANEAFDRFYSPKSVTSVDNKVTETA
ncbi:hypothetical protein Tco_1315127 [Tanacetum coccineum]